MSAREKWLSYLIFALFAGVPFVRDRPAPQGLEAALVFFGIVSQPFLSLRF